MRVRPVHYEPHPVSRERKNELKAKGLRIVDARFAPPSKQIAAPSARKTVTLPRKQA